jgi:hypothetical protein
MNLTSLYETAVKTNKRETPSLNIILIFGLIVFAAHYLRFQQFGFFGDDYAFLTAYLKYKDQSFKFLYHSLMAFFFDALPTGRPIGFWLTLPLTNVGESIGGKNGVFLVGFIIIWLNATLFYWILSYRFPQVVSLTGAIAYTLFPATTTSAYYTHFMQLNPSFTFCLASCILYLNKNRWLHYFSYLTIPLTLLTYESTILPFFAMPLLRYQWDKTLFRKIFYHISILSSFIAIYAFFRFSNQEQRILNATSNVSETLSKIFYSFLIGPYTVGKVYVLRLFTAIEKYDTFGFVIVIVSAVSLFFLFCKMQSTFQSGSNNYKSISLPFFLRNKQTLNLTKNYFEATKLLIIGAIIIVFSYSLAFTKFPPTQIEGQDTSVHFASSFGWGWFWAALFWIFFEISDQYKKRKLAASVIAIFFSLLIGFHIAIKNSYIHRYKIQKDFWTEVVKLCPDLEDETIVLFDTNGVQKNKGPQNIVSVFGFKPYGEYVRAQTLTALFNFPKNWKRAPTLLNFPYEEELFVRNDRIYWNIKSKKHYEWKVKYAGFLEPENIILLKYDKGKLVRIQDKVIIMGKKLSLKKLTMEKEQFIPEKSFLFDHYVINDIASEVASNKS